MALPSGYTQLDYIESGKGQYIDTLFMPTQNSKIEAVVEGWPVTEVSTALFGTQSSSDDRYDFFIHSSGVYRSYFNGDYVSFAESVSFDSAVSVVRDGTTVGVGAHTLTNAASEFACTTSLYLFAHNNNGSATRLSSLKLCSCRIFENGELVRDFVPALRNSDAAAGLYDVQNAVFYTNAGTGVFTYPGYVEPAGTHNALIDGAAYEVTGGKAMVGGTVYDTAGGKTLVDGTVYEIAFGGSPFTAAITAAGDSRYAYAEINGTKHYSVKTIECEAGTTVTVYVGATTMAASSAQITWNGTKVASGTDPSTGAEYSFVPDASTVSIKFTSTTKGTQTYWTAAITTS